MLKAQGLDIIIIIIIIIIIVVVVFFFLQISWVRDPYLRLYK